MEDFGFVFFSLCERKTNINYALRWFSCFHIFFEEKSIESRQDQAENKSIGPNLLSSSTSPGFTKKLRKFIYLFSASMFTHPHWAGVWCCVFASVIVGKIAVLVVLFCWHERWDRLVFTHIAHGLKVKMKGIFLWVVCGCDPETWPRPRNTHNKSI